MTIRALSRLVAFMGLLYLTPMGAQAAYSWPTVTPTNGGAGSGTSQNVGAVFKWGSSDTPPSGGGIAVSVLGGYTGTITINNQSINSGSLQQTYVANVVFSPALPSGTKYTVTFGANFPSGPPNMTATTVTVP